MPVGLVCPSCRKPATFHRTPVATCPECGAEYPPELRGSAEASLARQAAARPLLLTIGLYLSAFAGVITSIFLVLAPLDIGSYSINDQPVTGPEFLRRVGLGYGLAGVACLAIAFGLYRERTWARVLMLLYWVVLGATMFGLALADTSLGNAVVVTVFGAGLPFAVAYWYLYSKESVVAYYRALQQEESAREAMPQRAA